MSIIPEELKTQTFPCPNCGEIISTEISVCRFCSFGIDDRLRSELVSKELRERSLARMKNHKLYIIVGLLIFGAGVFTLLTTIVEAKLGSRTINFSCWTPLLVVGGLAAAVMGIRGYLSEKNYLKNV